MIQVIHKEDCVGCDACVQKCPKHCIAMTEDEQGFLYPKVDLSLCIDCHLCEKVCPVLNQTSQREPIAVYAAKNTNDMVRDASSSGGIFYALAETIINEGGVVFGARFNEKWEVVHDYSETLEGVKAFQGSKYVQSRIGKTFIQAEEFLRAGRRVMFTGTPCQLAALGLFLRKDYGTQLLKVDVVCHGVPSPLVWRTYLEYIKRPTGASAGKNTDLQSTLNIKMPVITGISFRDKRIGWEKYGFAVHAVAHKGDKNSDLQFYKNYNEEQELLFEPHYENIFMQAFLKDLCLRPSCYACPAKSGKSNSDLTLADFWNVEQLEPEAYTPSGTSLVLANTPIGEKALEICKSVRLKKSTYEKAVLSNPSLIHSVRYPKQADAFWKTFDRIGIYAIYPIVRKMQPSAVRRVLSRFKRLIFKILK